MKLGRIKNHLVPLVFLFFSFIYIIGLTANFTRDTYIPNILYPIKIFLVGIVIFLNVLFIKKRRPNRIFLIIINVVAAYFMLKELRNPDLHRGWLYKDVMISKVKHNKDLNLKYRLRAENFRQTNRTFFVELFPRINQVGLKKIELPELDRIVEGFLMYKGDETLFRGKNGERLIPSAVDFVLTQRNDSLILTTDYNTNQIVRHLIDLESSSAKFLDKKAGDVSNDSVHVYGKPTSIHIYGKDTIRIYE